MPIINFRYHKEYKNNHIFSIIYIIAWLRYKEIKNSVFQSLSTTSASLATNYLKQIETKPIDL